MADVRNFAEWDPGVKAVAQVTGDGPGADSAFDVTVKGFAGDMDLTYVTKEYDPPNSVLLVAESKNLTSVDRMTVRPVTDEDGADLEGGSVVTYDAELTLNGALGIADPVFQLTFDKIGDKAAKGLVKALDGTRLDDNQMSALDSFLDSALEFPVVTSFTRIGYQARKRLADWTELDDYDLSGRTMLVTGATSGLGRAAAEQLASCGAQLILVGRDGDRNQAAVDDIAAATGNTNITQVVADMGDLAAVRALAEAVLGQTTELHALIHNAGALSSDRTEVGGIEATVASQVVGPFLLTSLLLDRLEATEGTRVITMSSGGMYTAGLTVDGLQMSAENYSGTEQYARAKRAQVTLNEMWAERHADSGVVFHALHPGWADTPGVADALPGFGKVMGPLLRTPEEGADTMVWLAADDQALAVNGRFWLDRRERSIHKLGSTSDTDTSERRERLWEWVTKAAGVDGA